MHRNPRGDVAETERSSASTIVKMFEYQMVIGNAGDYHLLAYGDF